jgi:transposase
MDWVKRQVSFAEPALQATFLDYVHEVEHAADRIQRLEKAIDDAGVAAPAEIREVIQALQALRGVGKIVAVTVVAEVGRLSRFTNPRQWMGYLDRRWAGQTTTGDGGRNQGHRLESSVASLHSLQKTGCPR